MEKPPRGQALERRVQHRPGNSRPAERNVIRATVLIETIPAAFEMEEILYELREHSSGLNAGRWDYLFSIIKKFRTRGADFVLPERNAVTMTAPFMRAYTELLGQDLPRPRRPRDGRHGRLHPEPPRSAGQRGRAGQGARRQIPGVQGRVRRVVGRASRPGAGVPRGVRLGAGRCPEPADQAPRRRVGQPRPAAQRGQHARLDHRGRTSAQQRERRPAVPGQLAGRRPARSRSST